MGGPVEFVFTFQANPSGVVSEADTELKALGFRRTDYADGSVGFLRGKRESDDFAFVKITAGRTIGRHTDDIDIEPDSGWITIETIVPDWLPLFVRRAVGNSWD